MCLIFQTPDPCDHPICNQLRARGYGSGQSAFSPSMEMAGLLMQHAEGLRQLLKQSEAISTLLTRLSHSHSLSHAPAPDPWEACTQRRDFPGFLYFLQGDSLPKSPIMRESGFRVTGLVTDCNRAASGAAVGMALNISLYTADAPPRLLAANITGTAHIGKKILRGTLTAVVSPDSRFLFDKVVVNEVSSHYLGDEFTLVVSSANERVKPLAIRHLTVKARRKQQKKTEGKEEEESIS